MRFTLRLFIFRLELRRHRRFPAPSDVLRTDSDGRVSLSYLGPVYMEVGDPRWVARSSRACKVTPSTGIRFCHMSVSKWLDSCYIKFAPNAISGGFASLKLKAKALKGYSKSSN